MGQSIAPRALYHQALKLAAGQGHYPVQICYNYIYVKHKLISAGHFVRYTKNIYFKACTME